MQTFICTTTPAKLKEHSDNKHPKQTTEVSGLRLHNDAR